MNRMRFVPALACLLLVFGLVCGLIGPASARPWKPTAHERAQDYLQIEHSLSETEAVIIIWLAPQFFAPASMEPAMEQMFEQYALVSIMHFSMNDLGQWTAIEPNGVTLELSESASLAPLEAGDIPPMVSTILHFLESSLAGGFGAVGQGLKTFVYDGEEIDSCGGGRLWVRYLEERYEYEMPVPGCPLERATGVEQSG